MPVISRRRVLTGLLVAMSVFGGVFASAPEPPRPVFLSLADAQPALTLLARLAPAELHSPDVDTLPGRWYKWARRSDADIRARLAQGNEDSLVNLLLFGTSFTTEPRITARQIELITREAQDPAAAGERLDAILLTRVADFVATAERPSGNERFVHARRALEARGHSFDTAEGRLRVRTHMIGAVARVLREIDQAARLVQQTDSLGDPADRFSVRSRIYRERGLSSDTSLRPSFALEEALRAMRRRGQLTGPVRRVAIVGPGLDFVDKLEGYDFYPQQTLQPFTVIDSLLRLGLADARDLQVTTFDLDPKVNDHVASLRSQSTAGTPYVVQLPLDVTEAWTPAFVRYWETVGDQIGQPVEPASIPTQAGDVRLRAVSVAPAFGALVTPVDLNIVLQRLELTHDEQFDLVIGTNVFVYYDEFQQALTMLNIERMLKPDGVLLSNNALVELPTSRLRMMGTTTTRYSDREADGDIIIWYGSVPAPPSAAGDPVPAG